MDNFIGYSSEIGFVELEQANEALAQHAFYIRGWIYIGYKARFVQNLTEFLAIELSR